jgi:hypothetical protein
VAQAASLLLPTICRDRGGREVAQVRLPLPTIYRDRGGRDSQMMDVIFRMG